MRWGYKKYLTSTGRVRRICLAFGATSLILFSSSVNAAILAEALLAKVGAGAVRYSDVVRFLAVEEVMICSGIRTREGVRFEPLVQSLHRYVDEELIYLEARVRLADGSGSFSEAIQKIKGNTKCYSRWRTLGKNYAELWSTKTRPKAGEGMLVRELEKRLLVDLFEQQRLGSDKSAWLQDVRLKIPVKIYVD